MQQHHAPHMCGVMQRCHPRPVPSPPFPPLPAAPPARCKQRKGSYLRIPPAQPPAYTLPALHPARPPKPYTLPCFAAAGAYFSNLCAILLIVLVAQSWGLLFGGTFMDPKAAQTVTTVVRGRAGVLRLGACARVHAALSSTDARHGCVRRTCRMCVCAACSGRRPAGMCGSPWWPRGGREVVGPGLPGGL